MRDFLDEAYNILKEGWNKQIILYGPPGTSKTYSSTIIAARLLEDDGTIVEYSVAQKVLEQHKDRYKIVQFHPSYCYEDFVRGISVKTPLDANGNPTGGNATYEPESKIFELFCDKAAKDSDNRYVLIIDEINRAPLASVLGELIFALEKRGEGIYPSYDIKVKDVNNNYVEKELKVPENLYIIGTMNTADRSIGSMDYAVRRRFAFIPVLPQKDIISGTWTHVGELAVLLFDKLIDDNKNGVFKNVEADLDKDDIKIGHTYFLGKSSPGGSEKEELEYLLFRLNYQVLPIFYEYLKDGLLSGYENKDDFNYTIKKIVKDISEKYEISFDDNRFGIQKK